MSPDIVIGAISGYSYSQLQYWGNSLLNSGYRGRVLLVAYNADFDLVDRLLSRGIDVITFVEKGRLRRFVYPTRGFRHRDTSINRFYQIWRVLQGQEDPYRYVVAVDVRDVVFQRDPSAWLEENLKGRKLNVGAEGAKLGDEEWNSEVIRQSYGPVVHKYLSCREIYNAGTIAGTGEAMRDLMLNVYLCCLHNRVPYTDQAALNVLLSLQPYRSITRFNEVDADWACQAATVAAASEYLKAHVANRGAWTPTFDGEVVYARNGKPYCLVHQYDKVPEWKERLEQRYAD